MKIRHYSQVRGAVIDGKRVEHTVPVRSHIRRAIPRKNYWFQKFVIIPLFGTGFMFLAGWMYINADKTIIYASGAERYVAVKDSSIPPIMQKIAKCESGGKQFNEDGSLVRGHKVFNDVGKFQINEFYHEKEARKMGLDLRTEEGNTAYAMYLYETRGTGDWESSRACWSKM